MNRQDAKYAKKEERQRNWNVDLLIKINDMEY